MRLRCEGAGGTSLKGNIQGVFRSGHLGLVGKRGLFGGGCVIGGEVPSEFSKYKHLYEFVSNQRFDTLKEKPSPPKNRHKKGRGVTAYMQIRSQRGEAIPALLGRSN